MKTQQEKKSTNKRPLADRSISNRHDSGFGTFQFVDNRPEAAIQMRMQQMANQYVENRLIVRNMSAHPFFNSHGTNQLKSWSNTNTVTSRKNSPIKHTFQLLSHNYKIPTVAGNVYQLMFSQSAAKKMIEAPPRGSSKAISGRDAESGVEIGDIASYHIIQYLEKSGDGLTGDHQPSGAAVKEAIRIQLHSVLPHVLTREQARNAYNKAITIVMTDIWHKSSSRTYGGRNTSAQISTDASDLAQAAKEDWKPTVIELYAQGFTTKEIDDYWDKLEAARSRFYSTGNSQAELN
jgi:hypothetical protein